MLDFANKSNPYDDVKFCHVDISNLAKYEENSFDYAVMC
jgi:ubiquinone/menaquinone biosynthesis C-methylase UbiE